jgi:hypothetical protein
MYFDNTPSIMNYKWAQQLPSSLETSTFLNSDYSTNIMKGFGLYYLKTTSRAGIVIFGFPYPIVQYDLVIYSLSTGAVERHHQMTSTQTDYLMGSFGVFFNDMVHF